jgi:polysaccharide biosynthesis/export protein ExoF
VAEMSRPVDLQKQLESAFAEFLGRKGFVDIAAIAKQPVYVVGKVKNSGIFEYTPGMTVLHAIALAGGFDNTPVEAWQVTELSHATERVQISLDRTARMIARAVAIDAAGSSKPPVVPPELSELTGQDKAAAQISEELAPRKLAKKSLATDLKTLQASIESAAWDLDLRKQRMPLLDQSIALRQDRLVGLSKLSQSGFLGRPVLIQAQSELLEVEDRRQETLMSIDVAQDRLNKAKQELQTRQSTAGIDDEKDMLDARSEAAKAVSEGESAIGVIKAITKTALASPAAEGAKFYIIRHSKGTASVVRADETTLLQPGDLVQAGGTAKAPDLTAFDAN